MTWNPCTIFHVYNGSLDIVLACLGHFMQSIKYAIHCESPSKFFCVFPLCQEKKKKKKEKKEKKKEEKVKGAAPAFTSTGYVGLCFRGVTTRTRKSVHEARNPSLECVFRVRWHIDLLGTCIFSINYPAFEI